MILSQKKNCNKCRAEWYSSRPHVQYCTLNFKVRSDNYTGIPMEPCYKPMTNAQHSDALARMRR